MKLEEKYLKRIEEECFLDRHGKKVELDKDGNRWPENEPKNHTKADEILMDLLKELGYTELVKLYDSVSKWYE